MWNVADKREEKKKETKDMVRIVCVCIYIYITIYTLIMMFYLNYLWVEYMFYHICF